MADTAGGVVCGPDCLCCKFARVWADGASGKSQGSFWDHIAGAAAGPILDISEKLARSAVEDEPPDVQIESLMDWSRSPSRGPIGGVREVEDKR